MDISENIFGRLNRWFRKSETLRRAEFEVEFESIYPSLLVLAQGTMADDGVQLYLKPYEGFGSVFSDTLLLPNHYCPFEDYDLNHDLFLHKAIAGGILRHLNIRSVASSSLVQRAIQLAYLRETVIETAKSIFPEFAEWSDAILERHEGALKRFQLPEDDQAWLRIETKLKFNDEKLSSEFLAKIERELDPRLRRDIEKMPSLALAPWCEPIQNTVTFEAAPNSTQGKRERKENETEVEGKTPSEIEVIDFEKEKKKENPVTHSFEKLETADEYNGGFRSEDGSDQMQEQKNVVDELNMKHVTRGGEAASSTYKADIAELVKTAGSKSSKANETKEHLFYPEWNYQEKKFLPKHCCLYLGRPADVDNSGGEEWRRGILDKHALGLENWKHRLAGLINQRRWKDRQWEGSEVSIDSFVRYWGDAKFTGEGDSRLYIKNFSAVRDFTCLILIDQSFSTDSFVANRRVLDVELESLALVSELLAPIREPVAIAGTWSETRNNCQFMMYKDFEDPWSTFIDQVPKIVPQGYTRLGPAIRHSIELLSKQPGKSKLLVLLTDGKPTDYDRYEGRYGIEDIHHASLEAAQRGISLRALTIEKEAKNYFPLMFGPRDYQILKDPAELPERLFKIYFESIKR